ncbi:transposase [Sulfitobacter sp. LCG007]
MIQWINSALNGRRLGLFGMALRQTTGFVESLSRLVGLDWSLPDVSTLSRRQHTLALNIPYRGSNGPLHLLIPSHGLQANHCRSADRTGIKVEGEGEWHARKHGGPKKAGLARDPPRD